MKAIRTRMVARSIHEPHRVSSPLELLFDLTFVVAVGSLVTQLAHAVANAHASEAIGPFLMVFFAIWWAWNQFTWLASAYDTDDVLYRVFTTVQMGGVLVIAAGVPSAFEGADAGQTGLRPYFHGQDFTTITIGYLIMRLGLLAILVRAMVEDPESRPTSRRYVIGISVVQLGWILRLLFVPPEWTVPGFVVLATAELLVSPWADRAGNLAWHPHHIAERYGLFTIILLGESVLAVTFAVQQSLVEGITSPLVAVAVSGLVLLFTLWWLYFSEPAAEGLVKRRARSYIWGYGHSLLYASLAAIGAGLEVAVQAVTLHVEARPVTVVQALAFPVAIFLLLLWVLHAPIVDRVSIPPVATIAATALVLAVPFAATTVGVLAATIAITMIVVVLLVIALVVAHSRETADVSSPG